MIIALAGRRIDAEGVNAARFPLENVGLVASRIRAMLKAQGAVALVSSAACGADLLALAEAGSLGLRRRIVLPFRRDRFRETSVTDRPGNWGAVYDKTLDAVEQNGDLLVTGGASEKPDWSATNLAILDEAAGLAATLGVPLTVALVWEGTSRGDHDITEEFGLEARRRGLPVIEISTVEPGDFGR